MALKPGTLLGPHEIISLIGQGGMGEVYKARDTRLNRIVAIKTLPAHLAERPELRERFKREASTLANLKHAHICTLYDIGHQEIAEEDFAGSAGFPATPLGAPGAPAAGALPRRTVGIDYLVMEYLEGETLAERLKKGPLPLEQVLQFAIEISDALDKAHRANFTHRDIKPGNIMIVPQSGSGSKTSSKLLDFGLAKLKQEVAKAITPASELPTAPGVLTQHGTLLGTLQYMSPEQVEGKTDELDGRTDVFAFGAVVYEMATGKKAFDGKNQSSVIAKILEIDPPPMSTLQPPGKLSPPALDRVVKKCLAKDREERWQTAFDLWQDLEWIKEAGQAGMPAPLTARRKLRERLAWGVAAAAILVAAVALMVPYFFRGREPEAAVRFAIPEPSGAIFPVGLGPSNPYLTVSPDGRRVAFLATTGGSTRLWVRSLDSLEAQPLPGTEATAPYIPFWSPDSRFLGFFAQGKLKKVEVSGGPPQTLCDAPGTAQSGAWNRDGTILFDAGQVQGVLNRVPAAGGKPTPVTAPNKSRQEVGHAWPSFLPDGRHFLYLARNENAENNAIYAGSLDSQETKLMLNANSRTLYSPPGYLLFVRDGTLMAQPFDADRLQTTGDAFPIAERVRYNAGNGYATFSVSTTGVLSYRTTDAGGATELAWFDRSGKDLGRIGEQGPYVNPEISPDGKHVAVERPETQGSAGDIWVFDLSRGTNSRLTFDPANDATPVWSPDGSRIAFASNRNGFQGLYQKNSSGLGNEELLLKLEGSVGLVSQADDWSSDGRSMIYSVTLGSGIRDVWVLPLSGGPGQAGGGEARKPFPYLQSTQFAHRQPQLSPDGRWLAYAANESGQYQVYVQSFPNRGGKWQISTNGGVQPRWRADSKELFFIASDRKLMAVAVKAGATFEAGAPAPLFEARTYLGPVAAGGFKSQYDVAPDSQRFLLNLERGVSAVSPITVVLNWTKAVTSGK